MADRALRLAEEIKNKKRLRIERIKAAAVTFGLCSAVSVITLIFLPPTLYKAPEEYAIIEENDIPLGAYHAPDDGAKSGNNSFFTIPAYDVMRINADVRDVEMILFNPADNPGYFIFEIGLKNTGEILYKSDEIGPSEYTENITLSRTLEKGEYEGIMTVYYESEYCSKAYGSAKINFYLIAE